MGISTDANLCFGIPLAESTVEDDFPWDEEEFNGDYDEWLGKVRGDLPIEFVSHCSADYPMLILAVEGTDHYTHRGHPLEITKEMIADPPEEMIQALIKFLADHPELAVDGSVIPKWYLTSYMG